MPENSFCEKCFTISTRNFDLRKKVNLIEKFGVKKISVSVHGDVADGSDGGNVDNGGDGGNGDDGGDDGDGGDDNNDDCHIWSHPAILLLRRLRRHQDRSLRTAHTHCLACHGITVHSTIEGTIHIEIDSTIQEHPQLHPSLSTAIHTPD